MCIDDRVRYRCKHLGRFRGFKSCQFYDLNDMMIESGVPEDDPIVITNKAMCRKYCSEEYHEQVDLCVSCSATEEERKVGKSKGRLQGRGKLEFVDDEMRDTIKALFPAPPCDPKKMLKFSIGPSSSGSSRAPSLTSSSRPPSMVDPPPAEPRSSEDTLLYPMPEPRFDYPIGDITMEDIDRLEKYFQIKPPESDNWVFYSGVGISPKKFIDFRNAADASFDAKHFGDMYPDEVVKTHLFRYLRKETQWKALAMASYKFSCIVKGRVHLLLHRSCKDPLRPCPHNSYGLKRPERAGDSHWEFYEMWALTSIGRVTEIIRYNADDFSDVGTLWRAGMTPLGNPPDFWLPPRLFNRNSPIDHDLNSCTLWT